MLHAWAQKLGLSGKSVTCLVCIFCCTDNQVFSSLEGLNNYTFKRLFAKDLIGKLALLRGQAYQTSIRQQLVVSEEDVNKKPFESIIS